jgi:hypothetical protein
LGFFEQLVLALDDVADGLLAALRGRGYPAQRHASLV